jgi:hypothetical protein
MDIVAAALLAKNITSLIAPIFPDLTKAGESITNAAGGMIGEETWELAKSVWGKLSGRLSESAVSKEAVQTAAENPNDEDAAAALRLQIKRLLLDDGALASELEGELKRANRATSHDPVSKIRGKRVVAFSGKGGFKGNIDMSERHGPTVAETEAKEGRDRLREIVNQFDRRAIRDQMHEEDTFFMLKSLRELRVNIQRIGVNTLTDPVARLLLTEIREELEEIEDIASWILTIRPEDDWPESFLDYRVFGGMSGQVAYGIERGGHSLQGRLHGVQQFCRERVHGLMRHALNVDLRKRRERTWPPIQETEPDNAATPVNTDRLSKDIFCLYLFGRIDQLKDCISTKLERIRI